MQQTTSTTTNILHNKTLLELRLWLLISRLDFFFFVASSLFSSLFFVLPSVPSRDSMVRASLDRPFFFALSFCSNVMSSSSDDESPDDADPESDELS